MQEEKDTRKLVREHFDYLIKNHNFVFDESKVILDSTRIQFRIKKVEWIMPEIKIWLKSEPEFTCIDIHWLLGEYIDHAKIDKYLFEDRLKYEAGIIRDHLHELFYNLEPLLLIGLKRFFINFAKANMMSYKLTMNDYLSRMSLGDKRYYEYIKEKDPKWNPSINR